MAEEVRSWRNSPSGPEVAELVTDRRGTQTTVLSVRRVAPHRKGVGRCVSPARPWRTSWMRPSTPWTISVGSGHEEVSQSDHIVELIQRTAVVIEQAERHAAVFGGHGNVVSVMENVSAASEEQQHGNELDSLVNRFGWKKRG